MKPLQLSWLSLRGPTLMASLLGVIALITLYFGVSSQRALKWVEHTAQVQAALSGLSNQLFDTVQSKWLPLVATQEQVRATTSLSNKLIMDKFNAGAKLIVDNPQQVQNSNQLLTLIDAMFVADRALEDASRASVSGSENIKVALNAAQSSLVRVRQKINDMEAIEGKLLDERSTDATQSLRSFLIAIGSGVAVVAATLLIWWQMMQRAVVALAQTNADLSAAFVRQQNSESQIRQLQKMEAIGQLTGGLAHDFNNMLAVVIGALSLAQKRLSKGSADVAPLIAGAMDGATRAATLTSRLLAFSRQQPLTPETLNLNSIVGNMAEIIRRTIGDGIRVETVLAGGLWLTRVDASQMENALLNLCVNARDAMPDGGALTIETGNANLDDEYARGSIDVKAGQYVLIAVTDTGTGMSPDVMSSAIEPYFTTKALGKGSGLGLSQVFGFVKQSAGHLKIYSELGHGTTMKIYLPRRIGAETERTTVTNRYDAETIAIPQGEKSKIILVVEDEAQVREMTILTLRELGYTVYHAESAEAALKQLATRNDINLMFTDIAMPGINGRKLADEVGRLYPTIKVLFTTGFTRNAVVHGGVLDEGVNFIAKPFTANQLAYKVHAVFGSTPQA